MEGVLNKLLNFCVSNVHIFVFQYHGQFPRDLNCQKRQSLLRSSQFPQLAQKDYNNICKIMEGQIRRYKICNMFGIFGKFSVKFIIWAASLTWLYANTFMQCLIDIMGRNKTLTQFYRSAFNNKNFYCVINSRIFHAQSGVSKSNMCHIPPPSQLRRASKNEVSRA